MGPALKNKGRRGGGRGGRSKKKKQHSIVLSKGISEKLQVSLRRFWLLCVLLSNPASLGGCHFAFISADRPVVPHRSPSPAPLRAGAARLFTATASLILLTGLSSLLPFQSRGSGSLPSSLPFPFLPSPSLSFPDFLLLRGVVLSRNLTRPHAVEPGPQLETPL